MPQLRLATFNCENLMMRRQFDRIDIPGLRNKLTLVDDEAAAEAIDARLNVLPERDRTLTAQTLAATGADICALQEVENLVTLTAFHNRYLRKFSRRGYGRKVLKEGNDKRGIDVALLSRVPVVHVRSHAGATFEALGVAPPPGVPKHARAFRRDCLEVDVAVSGRALTLFICHFKSMHGGRDETRPIREAEARAVRRLVEIRFADPARAEWVILGDFNDFFEQNGQAVNDHGLGPFLEDGFAEDLAASAVSDPKERWSHHYFQDDSYNALDHIFLSPALAAQNTGASAKYVRIGTPYRVERYEGFRLPGIGWARPKASDHCPLVAKLQFEGRPIAENAV